jgi:hypothetical protein
MPRNRFVPDPTSPVAVDGLAAVTLPDGSVLVTGGQSSPEVATNVAVVIRPDGTLTRVAGMADAGFTHTMVTLLSGEVLVIGGTDDDHRLLTSTEIYNPRPRSFRAGPPLLQGRYKLSGVWRTDVDCLQRIAWPGADHASQQRPLPNHATGSSLVPLAARGPRGFFRIGGSSNGPPRVPDCGSFVSGWNRVRPPGGLSWPWGPGRSGGPVSVMGALTLTRPAGQAVIPGLSSRDQEATTRK